MQKNSFDLLIKEKYPTFELKEELLEGDSFGV